MFNKVVISGNQVEIYTFEKELRGRKLKRFFPLPEIPDEILRERADYLEKKLSGYFTYLNRLRAKRNFIRLINANATRNDKLLTLTFKENIKDVSTACKLFTQFIKRLKTFTALQSADFKYCAVIEFQDGKNSFSKKNNKIGRGVIHFHILFFDFPFIHYSFFVRLWRHGSIDIESAEINKSDNVGLYLSKYMSKEMFADDPRLKGKKLYFHSRNLKKPEVLNNVDLSQFSDLLVHRTKTYENLYVGKITIRNCLIKKNENWSTDTRRFIKLGYDVT